MNTQRRFSWTLPLFLLGGALLGVWLLDERRRSAADASIEHPDNADYYVLNARLTSTNPQGQPAYEMTADKVLYFADGTSGLQQVHAYALGGSSSAWDLRADRGRISADGNRVDLMDNVRMEGELKGKPILVTTQAITVYPDTEQLESAAAVNIKGDIHVTDAVGMRGEFSKRRLELLSNVKTIITPK